VLRKVSVMRLAVRVLATITLLFLTTGTAGAMHDDGPLPLLVPACCWLLFVALLFLYYLVVTVIYRMRSRDIDSPEDRP
jgi:hypothetical protein